MKSNLPATQCWQFEINLLITNAHRPRQSASPLSLSLTLTLMCPKTQSANMQICKFTHTHTHAQQIWNVDLNVSENAHLIKSALLRLLFEYYFIMRPAARQQADSRAEQLALSAVLCPLSVLIWQIQTEHRPSQRQSQSQSRSRRHSSARIARNICTKTHYFN